MARLKRIFRISLALAAASVALATPSQAAAGHTTHPQGKLGVADDNGISIYNRTQENIGNYPCVGHDWNFPNWPIASIATDCNRRVWLHREIDRSDTPLCVPPVDQAWVTKIPEAFQHPAILEVGAVGHC
ncbi:hypothetical protein SNOUR_20895 [Streptomyces noursei ATCC 11455]|nr:hypothetical protein SNOUR_20895 [Streptomyces noursei ATCC 11455]